METSIPWTKFSSAIIPTRDAGVQSSTVPCQKRSTLCSGVQANASQTSLKTSSIARKPMWKELMHKVHKAMTTPIEMAVTQLIDHLFIPVLDEPRQFEKMGTFVVDAWEPLSLWYGLKDSLPSLMVNFGPVPEIGEKVQVYVTEGAIPRDFPPGCFVRNGPNAQFGGYNLKSPFGKSLYHWFEGDGMLHATWFEKDGTLWYKNKYVETESFKLEKERRRTVYLPTMDEESTCDLRLSRLLNLVRFGEVVRDPGNVSIFEHGGRVVTACDGGKPYEIDISDLSTIGECTWNGQWDRHYTGPHPKVTPNSKNLVLYGFDVLKPYYRLGVVSEDGQNMMHTINVDIDRLVLIHDIGVTDKYAIIFDFPIIMDIKNMILKGDTLLKLDNTYSRIGVVPLEKGNKDVKWFDVQLAYLSHQSNIYQEGDEIVVHGVVTRIIQLLSLPHGVNKWEFYARGMALEDIKDPLIDGVLYEHLHEWLLNLRTGEVVERDITDKKFPLELPRINDNFNGKKYQFCYVASQDIESSKLSGFPKYGRIAKIDVSHKTKEEELKVLFHEMGPQEFCQEPIFVARPNATIEDDGWIVTYVHNEATNTSQMVIVDAQNLEGKPLARITLPQRVPYGFHGAYIQY